MIGGVPRSTAFDDIYFSSDDGVAESRYHFIEGNALPTRFERFSELSQSSQSGFTIAETGFGTGLNALLTAELWQQAAPPTATLNYISVEKYPIAAEQLQIIYDRNGWSSAYTSQLLAEYPPLSQGVYSLRLADNIQLTLLWGDAATQFQGYEFCADAWFLDGFAPSKNPAMWSTTLFSVMAARSRLGTTFATFTAASAIRRGLTDVGFQVRKGKGFGRKRERLLGVFTASPQLAPHAGP